MTVEECLEEAEQKNDPSIFTDGSIVCAEGYTDNKELHPITIECNNPGSGFTFRGCYPLDEPNSVDALDKTDKDDPTTEQLALRIIKENALFHFDPSSGSDYVTIDNGKVAEIKSLPTKSKISQP